MNKILYQILLWKAYAMTGYALTQFVKYFIMLFVGWEMTGTRDLTKVFWVTGIYIIFCFILGLIWYKFGLVNAEQEIGNQYDPLAKQLRGKFRMAKDIKSIKS